ncbi:hypothetical protein ATN81_03080 [Agrobacterium pusense]|uniref:hypothetical protein n=1 Tax=Agrobacterium pusense TaxID=648995 RepID=UPI000929E122|nr:hypothetical protein [Agrobacterium pusense]OJH51165.1 hypothetical protein ATN81_03080 [Agrobacterium pusense]OJH56020.1 hypothetical protein BA725_03940 [Agrobacterium pusense]
MNNALYALEGSISAIRAFNDLLAAATYQGDPLNDISGGIHVLLGAQVDALAAAETALRGEITDLKKQVEKFSAESAPNYTESARARELRQKFIQEKTKEGYEPCDIAQALNLKKSTVERVIAQLRGKSGNPAQDVRKAVNE